ESSRNVVLDRRELVALTSGGDSGGDSGRSGAVEGHGYGLIARAAGAEPVAARDEEVEPGERQEHRPRPAGVGQREGGHGGGAGERGVVERVVQGEGPATEAVGGVALDDRVDGDLRPLRGQAQQKGR